MKSGQLLSYAVLKNLHDARKDLLEAFVPFVEYALATAEKQYLKIVEIQDCVNKTTHLLLPVNTLRTILKKLSRVGKVKPFESYKYIEYIRSDSAVVDEFKERYDSATRERNALVSKFIAFAGLQKTSEDAVLTVFVDFIEDRIELLDLASSGDYQPNEINPAHAAIAKFIAHIKKYDTQSYNAFRNIYFGAILSHLTDLSQIQDFARKAKKLTIYLDSNILFRLLDLQNPIFNAASHELFEMLKKCGFALRCFKVTCDEMRRVLSHRYSLFLNRKLPESISDEEAAYVDGIIGAFYRKKMTLSQMETYIQKLELTIEKLGISVDHHDFFPKKTTLSEAERQIYYDLKVRRHLGSRKLDDYDRDYDVDSLVSIEDLPKYIKDTIIRKAEADLRVLEYIRQQRGGDVYSFSDSKMVFLTCDKILARFNSHPDGTQKIPEAIGEEVFTNVIWLSNPTTVGNVPIDVCLSAYEASSYFDFRVLRRFREYLRKFKERDPEEFELIGDIYSNQIVMSKLKYVEHIVGESDEETEIDNIVREAIEANKKKVSQLEQRVVELSVQSNGLESKAANAEKKSGQYKLLYLNERTERFREKANTRAWLTTGVCIAASIACAIAWGGELLELVTYLVGATQYDVGRLIIGGLPLVPIAFLGVLSWSIHRPVYDTLLEKYVEGKKIRRGLLVKRLAKAIWKAAYSILSIGIAPIVKAIFSARL
jgi:hypothetical protein